MAIDKFDLDSIFADDDLTVVQQPDIFAVLDSPEPQTLPAALSLSLQVSDPEVIVELLGKAAGRDRNSYALLALRIGIISMRQASGQLDFSGVKDAGDQLLGDLGSVLQAHGKEMTDRMVTTLMHYFDPRTGLVPQRLQSLVQKDGELERILSAQFGAEGSVMAKTLARHLGEGSPIFNLLSPTHSNGLRSQIEKVLEQALVQQRDRILREFSLDHKESALSRLVLELTTRNDRLGQGLAEHVDDLVEELSLDCPDSALSRLVGRVEQAHRSIANEFSTDNEQSAMSKLSKTLQNTNSQISENLSLDNEHSALARLKKELQATLDEMVRANTEFQSDVRATLEALQARKRESERSTRHGEVFEQELGLVISRESQSASDILHSVGNATGVIRNRKFGDYVISLSPDSTAPGVNIVWEAKEDKSYDLKRALEDIEL